MARVLNRGYAPRVRAGRRLAQRGGRPAPEKLVRTLVVVEDAEPVEGALLGGQVTPGWRRGRASNFPLQRTFGGQEPALGT